MGNVNIIVNGVKTGEQRTAGEMHSPGVNPVSAPKPAGSKVLVNGVPTEEVPPVVNPQTGAINLKYQDEFPPIPEHLLPKSQQAQSQDKSTSMFDDDTFSIAENYMQWINLKQNPSLDKMFLASTPDALMHLMTLHKYIGEVLDLDKNVQAQVNHADDDSDEDDDMSAKDFKDEKKEKAAPVKKAPAKKGSLYSKFKKNKEEDL
jgi:hypothetical protein